MIKDRLRNFQIWKKLMCIIWILEAIYGIAINLVICPDVKLMLKLKLKDLVVLKYMTKGPCLVDDVNAIFFLLEKKMTHKCVFF